MHRFKGSYFSYILIFFCFFFCMAAFSSVISVYLTGIGIRMSDMGTIVSSASLFGFVMIPLTGIAADRTRRPRLICGIMMIAVGLCAVLFSFSHTVALLFVLNGLTMSFINAVQPILERLAGSSKYRYGILRVWGTIGYAVGAQTAGFVIEHLPSRVLFLAILVAGALVAVGCYGAEDPIVPQKEEADNASVVRSSMHLSSFLKNPNYVLFFVITVLFWGCSGANMTYVPVLLQNLGIRTDRIGTIIFFSTLVEIPLIVFSNRFMDKFTGRQLIFFSCGLTLFEFLVYALSGSGLVVTVVVILLKAIATTTYVMIILKVVRNLVKPELTTSGLSIVNTGSSLGTILLQNLGGRIVESTSVQQFYLVLSGCMLLTIILTLFLKVGNDVKSFS